MGIDIGSTTAKVVVVDHLGEIVFSTYQRHNAETLKTLIDSLNIARQSLGNIDISFLITGSAGLGISESYKLPFIQEVVASAEVVNQRFPEVRTLIDIGGEDAKIIFFDENKPPDIRMNGACAGGTGAFIDEMATLLNVHITEIEKLASKYSTLYPMASRCGVFAKTDLQNLLSRQVPKEDIAASVFQAVVLQTLATLSRGREVQPKILFSGGPLTFMPTLKETFLRLLNLTQDDMVEVDSAELFTAFGAALAKSTSRKKISIEELIQCLSIKRVHSQSNKNRLDPLFYSIDEHQDWEEIQKSNQIKRVDVADCIDSEYFLGIDSGSTTTKLVLIDENGRVVFSYYSNNKGNAIEAARKGMEEINQTFANSPFMPKISRSVVTGYGEDLIRNAFGVDDGIVETLAHYQAAKTFDPNVSFILDIGGQDMKAIFVQDGKIQNIEINEACSSGCGSFIESFANNMNYNVVEFSQLACEAESPYNLGTRCTVFMNSRVKQALREGAHIKDISAGLAYSVIKNALHKVLKIVDTAKLGEHIVVQGGTFRNPAVQKALEELLGRPVVCPDMAELMGAYGAALIAREEFLNGKNETSSFLGLEEMGNLDDYVRREIRCRDCENTCAITKLVFSNENGFYSGNRCEKIYSNNSKADRRGVSIPTLKNQILFDRTSSPKTTPLMTLGIPRVLNMFENFPFWNTLFVESGIKVHLSAPSSNGLYQSGAAHIMSENLCFPGKLVSGHIMDLVNANVDRIFYPMVFYEENEFADANNSFNCPIVSGYPDVIRSSMDLEAKYSIPLDSPSISFKDKSLLKKACIKYLGQLGILSRVAKKAYEYAIKAQIDFKDQLIEMGAELIRTAEESGRPLMMLMGRPYQIDPLISHNVPEILVGFGVDVITEDCIPMHGELLDTKHVMTQWEYLNRYYRVARWVGNHENVELVQLNSFGCGPDSFVLDEISAILAEYGKRSTVIRIDEIESIGSTKLRLRSMMESLRQASSGSTSVGKPRKTTKTYQTEDRSRTLIVPDFSQFCSPPVVRPFMEMGYKIVQLPPPTDESVETGLKYTNNEICYPGIITLGDIIKGLQSGEYDLSRTAIGFSQTGGQCRATSYPSMIKKAMVAAGFDQVPVVTLSTSLDVFNDQPGFKFDIKEYLYKATVGMMFTDALSEMYYATVSREKVKGTTQAIATKYLDWYMDGRISLKVKSLLEWLRRAIREFNQIKTNPGNYPRVGIVGEIYVKYNSFSNNHVAQWLIDQGIEVVIPSFFEFFDGGMVSEDNNVRSLVKKPSAQWMLTMLGQKLAVNILGQFDSVKQNFRYYHPHRSIKEVASLAEEILSLNHQYGEGWLIAGEVASMVLDGVKNVLCLQPFGCIANHVVAKGVQKKLKDTYPQLNLLFLDADAGVSDVNFFNRMHFFVNHARTEAKPSTSTEFMKA